MNLRPIKGVYIKNKKVLVRVGFNVSIDNGKIKDDFRMQKVVPTILYLLSCGAKVIIITHFGRPGQSVQNKKEFSVRKVACRFEKILHHTVHFIPDCIGKKASNAISKMKQGDIVMLENLRFHKEEEENNSVFAGKLAEFVDIYVNEAFSASHRKHASVSAITRFLPSYAGPLLIEEVRTLHKIYSNPKLPLVIVIGGAKIGTKVKLIQRFFSRASDILIGGAIANCVLKAKGIAVGKSKVDKDTREDLSTLRWTSPKIHLPVDVVVAREISQHALVETKGVGKVMPNEIILDIGPDTIKLFLSIVASAKTIVWNGPLGFYELPVFSDGTKSFAKAIAKSKAFTVVGGGDSVTSLDALGLSDKINFISTGGGAMLAFLSGISMPGIEPLIKNEK